MKSNDLDESEHLSIWKCSGKTNERSWNCLYSIIHWFKAANISAFLYFWSYGLEWNNRQPSNMKHYQAWGFFLIGIFDISLFSSLPWSLITFLWQNFGHVVALLFLLSVYGVMGIISLLFSLLLLILLVEKKKKYWSRLYINIPASCKSAFIFPSNVFSFLFVFIRSEEC